MKQFVIDKKNTFGKWNEIEIGLTSHINHLWVLKKHAQMNDMNDLPALDLMFGNEWPVSWLFRSTPVYLQYS